MSREMVERLARVGQWAGRRANSGAQQSRTRRVEENEAAQLAAANGKSPAWRSARVHAWGPS